MRSITRRPRSASRRSPDAVIDPSGNAIAAATPSRSGVSGVILSGGGIDAIAQQHMLITQLSALGFLGLVVEEQMVVAAKVELPPNDLV